ncbi:hypothetical protein [Roseateles sp.]|uniref:hypothetical protein n=1 Tax=Roseateles sp. TaxID=1971397 RepID=UPI00394F8157
MLLDHCFINRPSRSARNRRLALLGLLLASAALLSGCGKSPAQQEREAQEASYREKYAKAKALFEERCKTAGVVVKRVVKDVEGIELTRIRPEIPFGGKEYFDPMYPGAAMADEAQALGYIESFLWTEYRNKSRPSERGHLHPPTDNELPPSNGYRYVEAVDPSDGRRYRYELPRYWSRNSAGDPGVVRLAAGRSRPRFAVDYEDLVEPADRALWIAGTRIKVIDQETGELVAQLTRYVWDPGFGGSTSGRWPWQHAGGRADRNCPTPYELGYQTRKFVDTVLQPK